MNISAIDLSFDESMMWLAFQMDASSVCHWPISPVCCARPEQRLQYEISGNGTSLHWEALDEDISVGGLLMGVGDQTQGHSLMA